MVNSGFSLAPGGLSFTHDQGTHNQFSPFGQSAYELKNLTGCFSFMTAEQLCNWLLIAASYVASTNDSGWSRSNAEILKRCFFSLVARTGSPYFKPAGIMKLDTALTGNGQEITTYDSLDASLGQARNNLYLAVKFWATYLAMYRLLHQIDETGIAEHAWKQADQVEAILSQQLMNGSIPAIFEQDSSGYYSRILPACEGLVYANYWDSFDRDIQGSYWLGLPSTKPFLDAMRTHMTTLLSDADSRNKFPDHGLKLSSTSNNSWLSKIAIVQHVARALFNLDENGNTRNSTPEPRHPGATGWEHADAAHVKWLTTGPGAYWCACDQIVNGEARGSKYYPRLITMALWLREVQKP